MVENTTDVESLGLAHSACREAIDWATANCRDAVDIWNRADAEKLLWVATRRDVLTDQQLLAFVEWALVNTPPPPKDAARIRACLDGSDRLTYPTDCSRARWAALAIAARGRLPKGTVEQTREAMAAQVRKMCAQPFAIEATEVAK